MRRGQAIGGAVSELLDVEPWEEDKEKELPDDKLWEKVSEEEEPLDGWLGEECPGINGEGAAAGAAWF